MRCAASGSSMIALSVISRHSADGGRALSRSAASTTLASCGLESWRGERLTAITKSVWPCGAPRRGLAAGLAEHPLADLDDQPALLGDRDEAGGGDRAELRVLPAQQRLDAEHPRGVGEHDLGLVGERELPGGERVAQLGLELEPLDGARAHRAVEELQLRLAVLLGLVHRGVGVAQQLLGGRRRCRRRPRCRCSTERKRWRPSRTNGRLISSATRSAIRRRSDRLMIRSSRITNSSPPKRAIVSPGRTAPVRRSAAATSSSSPARWPSESLMTLKSSMSANRTARRVLVSRRRSSASASVRSKSARLGSPVSGSWWAWWSRRSASCLRAVMSTPWEM